MKLGYVGVGNMGGAIASALARSHEVRVFDRSEAAMNACVAQGALGCGSVGELAAASELILLCLPSDDVTESVLAEGGELAAAATPGSIIVDQSTADPRRTVDLAAHVSTFGLRLVDAPVSGGPTGVAGGTIAIMIGGSGEQFAHVAALFAGFTRNLFHTGPVGSAMMTKVANNYVAAAQASLSLQALAMAMKFGCDPATTVDVMNASSGANSYTRRHLREDVLSGRLAIAATIDIMRKDVALALSMADEADVPLLGGEELSATIRRCIERHGQSASYNAIAATIGEDAGVAIVGSAT